MILFLLLLGLALAAATPSQEVKLLRGDCPMFWFGFNGRCYKYVATQMTWADSELHCVSEGANLASIHSLEEHNFINDMIKNFDPVQSWTWIGLSDTQKEGGWMWSDGSNASYFFWHEGQPDNAGGVEHCGHTNVFIEKTWNDLPCSRTLSFVCASRAICP